MKQIYTVTKFAAVRASLKNSENDLELNYIERNNM